MANMNFGVNILPKANNTYTLGNSDYKWNIFANTLNGISLTNIITDIQVDGTSIISNNIATLPIASADNFGVTKIGAGLYTNNSGVLFVNAATSAQIKGEASNYVPIVPARQHEAVFYGLAKAAGDSTQAASSNAVGTYTDDAKAAIIAMVGALPILNPVINNSISMGRLNNSTIGAGSVALGSSAVASGNGSVALGTNTQATTMGAVAMGYGSIASGLGAFAEGNVTTAAGTTSHAEGNYTIANGGAQHASGTYNIADSYDNWPTYDANETYNIGNKIKVLSNGVYQGYIKTGSGINDWTIDVAMNYAEIVGNGTANNARSNARALTWEGDERLKGDLYVHCNNDSTGGTRVAMINEVLTAGFSDSGLVLTTGTTFAEEVSF